MPFFDFPPLARRLVLATLVALHVAAILVVGIIIQRLEFPEEYFTAITLGVCSGEASMAAVWLALGPQRLLTRASLASLALALCGLPFVGFALREGQLAVLLTLDGILLAQFALMQLPLWLLRAKRGMSFRLRDDAPPAELQPAQFGIRQLLLWTAGTGIVLGVARLIMPREVLFGVTGPDLWHMFTLFVVLLGFQTLMPLSIVAAAFARRFAPLWIFLALFAWVLGCWLELWLFMTMIPTVGTDIDNPFFWINGPHAAWLLGCLLVLRICGYRLAR